MDGHREVDAMNDASLDRELQSLMAAEPSPEFLARVRVRVAQEPAPNGWRTSWMFAVAGALVIVIAAVVAWPSSEPVVEQPEPTLQAQRQQPAVVTSTETTTTQPVVAAPTSVRPQRAARSRLRGTEADRRELQLPEVVTGDNEVRAYGALVASVRESRFNAAVPAAPDLNAPLDVKELSPVEPLEIAPIVRLAAVQAEGERP
jgi:hypothetical protein